MVAYSFKTRFAEAIVAGTKRQTVRANRKRHARPGEMLQLFTGMRTRQCRKIVEVKCRHVRSIAISVGPEKIDALEVESWPFITTEGLEAFARQDGFASLADMHAFWLAEHGVGLFEGVLILW